MKADLDRLMETEGLDALVIPAAENDNPYRAYLSNGAHYTGDVIKKRGEPPVLLAHAMERDEAAKSGLIVYTYDELGYGQLYYEHGHDMDAFNAAWYRRIFEKLAVSGHVAFYGVGDINRMFRMLLYLRDALADRVTIVPGAVNPNLFNKAYETKDTDEIARLRDVAARTSAVAQAARAWIAEHCAENRHAENRRVIQADGSPLTIGDVKRYVRGQLFERDLEDIEGMIFAQGRDAGVPHSKGEDSDPVRLGETIVFDLFPREPGGYFHDMTRTWCIGYASPEAQAAYDAVMEAYHRSIRMCKPGTPTANLQEMVCAYFEERGHPTVRNTPGTTDGYVHSLAHGLGLNVHEAPYFRSKASDYHIQVGNVFTIEPGLYYPERGYGVRIEDTVTINESGSVEVLTDCPYDLIIELNG
ncbi:MAG: aminopeptidase P family protein [Anaerolineae bacterium]|nr:aminopeptidase P family protein [Anaerolineae bacterium]